ncbi:FxSxx-COOH system tetratricopeptide repeat protein [Actinoplanes sp. N902-109]|uniref:FxSxx-COOH system tetratricopeptide repeat protein n=1 Tax=Actinoplanes sp. (strain N902-109) TaxID=649831 RepID=UPI00032945C0|nr:FxSxx-COOH system tetratricopeptide repeat protein [Actinoplanes sp. N902-109]AGL14731.1 NB-ARC domain-containing protein [Actinoplanes sp. N902-109]
MPIRGGLPPRNPQFVGREDLLSRMRGLLGNGPVVLLPSADHQLGGTGRTQLAVEYAYRYAETYDLVWWIPAEQTAGMRAALVGLASELKLPEARDINRTLGAVRDALSRGEPFRNWLVVFENANRPEDIKPYLPSGAGHVLVTSRNPRWTSEVAQAVPVPVFGRTDSVDFLRRRAPELPVADAERLADRLDDVPMALDLAAAVRVAAGWSVDDYLARYDARAAELAFPTPIRVAWGIAADGLAEASPAAFELLQLSAFLASAPVSWELFWAARGLVSPVLAPTLRIERRLKAAIRLIGRYGLADLDPPGAGLIVHPLIRGMLGQQLSSERHATLLRTARAMLAAADPGDPDNPAHWLRYADIVPHLVHSDVLGGESEEIRHLVINCVRFLYARGDYDSSRDLAQQTATRWRDSLGETDDQTMLVNFHLANALRAVGRTADARALNAQTLRLQRDVLGGDDETTLATANSVGADLRMQGHFDQARRLDADNLVRYRRLFGESFPTALRCANNLAADLRLLGDFRGARAIDEQVLRQRQLIFVDGHPETLSSRASLAYDLYGLGDYPGAAALLAVAGHFDTLGADHPMTLWAGRFAAMAARRSGRPEARDRAAANVELYRQKFGDLSVETLAAVISLANCARDTGDVDEAHRLLERAVARYHAVLGDEHPFTLAAAANLAVVVRATGRHAEARTIDAEALGGLRRSVGADHPFTLSCANGLAADLIAVGEAQPARELALDTLNRSRSVRGADHPDTLACAFNVALDAGDDTAAAAAIEGLQKAYGDGHFLPARAAAGLRLETEIELPPL